MRRVPYLAALAGAAGRRQAPLLHPPRRLFPHEPPPVQPSPPSQPAEEGVLADPARREPSVSPTAPLATERVAEEPASVAPPKVVPLLRARSSDAARAPVEPAPIASRAAPPAAPPQRDATRVVEAAAPPKTRAAAQTVDTPRPGREEARPAEAQPGEPQAASREREPARAVADRRPTATPEPARLRPRAVPEAERATTARPPKAPAERARAPQLHIGSIDVVVTPPPMAPVEPALVAPPVPARRSSAPFDARNPSTTSWFGLAQR